MDRARAKRWAKRAGLTLGGVLLFAALAIGALFIWLGTDSARRTVLGFVENALAGQGLFLEVAETAGQLPFWLDLKGVSLADTDGSWLSLDKVHFKLSPFKLLGLTAKVDDLHLEGLSLARLPQLPKTTGEENPAPKASGLVSISLPIDVHVDKFLLLGAKVGADFLAGFLPEKRQDFLRLGDAYVYIKASAGIRRGDLLKPGNITVDLQTYVDLTSGQFLSLSLSSGRESGLPDRLRLDLAMQEGRGGLLASLSGLADLPPYSVKISSDSSLRAPRLDFSLEAERLASVSGNIAFAPVRGVSGRKDSLERLASPNWQTELDIKAEPGSLLSEKGSIFAVLPPETLEFIGSAVELSLRASSHIGPDASEFRVSSLRFNNHILAAGLDEAVLRVSGVGPELDFDGTVLAQITGEEFFSLLGVEDDGIPLFGKSDLRLAVKAKTDLGAGAFAADFSLKGPLSVESRYELFCGDNANVLAADLELAGNFDGMLKLGLLRVSSLGLDIEGKASLAPSPLDISLEAAVSGERRGEWNNILQRLSSGIPATGFKASLTAGLSQKDKDAELELGAKLSLAASEFAWPVPELEKAFGTYAAVLGEFSGPVMSPYIVQIGGFSTGFAPVEPVPYIPGVAIESAVAAHGRGSMEISIPGTSPQSALPRHSKADQTRITTLNGQVEAVLGNIGLFLPANEGISGQTFAFASITGLAGGGDTSLHMEARLESPQGSVIASPLGDVTLAAEAGTDLSTRNGLSMTGTALLNAETSKAGPIYLNTGWSVDMPENAGLKLAVHELVSSFAGLMLTGDAEAEIPATGSPNKPLLGGKVAAHFENWKGLNDIFKRLELNIPPVTGTPLDLLVEMKHGGAGGAVGQNATLSFDLERLYMLMNPAASAALLPASGEKQPPLGTPGMILLNGIQARVEIADLWGKRLMSAHAKSDSGSLDIESWESFALYLYLAGNTGRVNMAMRDDGNALGYVQSLEADAPVFTREMVGEYLRENGNNGMGQSRVIPLEGVDDAQARAEAGLAEVEMAALSGIFRLNPLAVRLERAAVYAPELDTGLYLQSPAFISVDDDIVIKGVNFAVLPNGFLRADARFSVEQSHASTEIKDLPLALVRKLAGVPLPDGELSLTSTMNMSGGQFGGESELSARLRPAVSQTYAEEPPRDLLLKMKGVLSKKSGEFNLPTRAGLVRLVGSGSLGGLESDGKTDLRLAFDIPFHSSEHGMLMLDNGAPLAATLGWKGELGRVWALLPVSDRYLDGMGQLDFKLGGTLSRLEYGGSAYFAGARYEDRVLGFLLEDINLEAVTAPQGSRIVLAAKDGREGSLAVEAHLSDSGFINTGIGGGPAPSLPTLTARGQLNHLAPLHRDDFYLRLSGIFDASGPLLMPLVQGKFEIEQGNLNLLASLGGGVTTLPVEERSEEGVEKTAAQSPRLDISVEAPRRFYVRGAGMDSEWQVSATVKGQAANPDFVAVITPVRGYFDLLSRQFAFSKGQIRVWGNNDYLDSDLDLLLTHTSPSLTAEINAGGSIKRPTLTLTSTPAMPQDQILAQVIFGKDITQLSAIEALQVANGIRQIMSFGQGGIDLVGDLRNLLGVDTLRIGSSVSGTNSGNISGSPDASAFGVGSGADAQAESTPAVEAGKYINDSIYVGVEQGTVENSTRVRVEIELKPNLTLQGSSGGDSSQVGLGWKRDY